MLLVGRLLTVRGLGWVLRRIAALELSLRVTLAVLLVLLLVDECHVGLLDALPTHVAEVERQEQDSGDCIESDTKETKS